mgnify:CR=1 FL=1
MTALSIVQDACGQMGITVPTVVFTSTNQQVIQLRTLMNTEGKQLAQRHQWQRITVQQTFTTVALQAQSAALPSDFDRFCNDSMWNRTTVRKVYGPLTEQEYQQYQAYPIFTTVNPAFFVRGNVIQMQPIPTADQTVAYSYVSTNWAETSGGTGLAAMTADTDVSRLPEMLVTLGVIWRFKKSKGFDYAEDFNTYQEQVAQVTGRDGGSPKLNTVYGLNRFSPYPFNVPEGSWPSS